MELKNKAENFLKEKNIPVVGASSKKEKWGYKIFKKLQNKNFNPIPVHPAIKEIDTKKVYSNLNDIPEEFKSVLLVVNPQTGIKLVPELVELNVENVWLQPGASNIQLINELEKNNINVIHDYCILVHLSS
ncbi:MAG: CoA-binding protein [Candidatus Muiribacteriota bacterium]